MNMLKISIITITYNSEKTLERTIQSIITQHYNNLEYIIIDGGSSDRTVEIIKQYKNNITYWISEPDNGISDAFNKGIQMANGDVIGIINSDDGLCPGALYALAEAYSPKIDVYRGKVLLWKEDTDTKVVEIPSMHFTFGNLNNISHQSTFISKNAYKKYGTYDERCQFVMDYDLLLRYERAGANLKYIDKILAFYSLAGLTFTKYSFARRKETESVMRRNGANNIDIWKYRAGKYIKLMIKKIIKKETLMKIRHGFCNKY